MKNRYQKLYVTMAVIVMASNLVAATTTSNVTVMTPHHEVVIVTTTRYCAFLKAVAATDPYGLYSDAMKESIARSGSAGSYNYSVISGEEHTPIMHVSYDNQKRFHNWNYNGKPSGEEGAGTTETGLYNLEDDDSSVHALFNIDDPTQGPPSYWDWN